ncbi:MAG: DUF58 domain-containing protein [Pseudomonadaceae bacterium]|nr:DUF58 domain-containing protein [Pseudomonadaceae bacterium]
MSANSPLSDIELHLSGAYTNVEALLSLRGIDNRRRRRVSQAHATAGALTSRQRGRGVDFAEVRAYQAGDDVRTIDWRVTARTNEPHTKVFREERERPTLICVDQSQSMFFGSRGRLKSVLAAELAARHAWQALAMGDRVGSIVVGNADTSVQKPKRSARHVARLLGDVANANQNLSRHSQVVADRQPMLLALRALHELAPSGHRVIVISDFSDMQSDGVGDPVRQQAWREVLLALARHNDASAEVLIDPLEGALPLRDPAAVTDGANRLEFDAGSASLRARYQEQFSSRLAACCELLLACRWPSTVIRTDGQRESAHRASTIEVAEAT